VPNVTSPGHKLGQRIGNFFEDLFRPRLIALAGELGLYCDRQGLRATVRGKKRKVTWYDSRGNPHDLDYVYEKDGSYDVKGVPAAFIELAYRRYTKHSRNKAGEIEGALVHLGETYRDSCRFLGAILGGEFTDGALNQLRSHGIVILYVPFELVVRAFATKGLSLVYPENATNEFKVQILKGYEALSNADSEDVKTAVLESIKPEYDTFVNSIKTALLAKIDRIRVLPLFGKEMVFASPSDAIAAIRRHDLVIDDTVTFTKFEVYVRWTNGNTIDGSFNDRAAAINFLRQYE